MLEFGRQIADEPTMARVSPLAIVRAAWAAQARDGLLALLPFAHPDLHCVPRADADRVLHGHAEFERFVRDLRRDGVEVTMTAHRFEDHEGCVVIGGRQRVYARGSHSDVPVHWSVEVRDGLIICVRALRTRSAAREACAA